MPQPQIGEKHCSRVQGQRGAIQTTIASHFELLPAFKFTSRMEKNI
jgi:hypothetical protein